MVIVHSYLIDRLTKFPPSHGSRRSSHQHESKHGPICHFKVLGPLAWTASIRCLLPHASSSKSQAPSFSCKDGNSTKIMGIQKSGAPIPSILSLVLHVSLTIFYQRLIPIFRHSQAGSWPMTSGNFSTYRSTLGSNLSRENPIVWDGN